MPFCCNKLSASRAPKARPDMKRTLPSLLLLLALPALAANPRSIALTIQDSGRAQIAETHDLPPPAADGLLRVGPVPETILSASVNATPLSRDETLDILSQRFSYDLRDNESLFLAFFDKAITARRGVETLSGRLAALPDFSSAAPSLLLATEGQPVCVIPDISRLDSIEFPSKGLLSRSPTLLWQTAAGQPPPVAVQIDYAADGFAWLAAHEAILTANKRAMSLSTRVCISNATIREFAHARIRLALSDKGRFAPLVPAADDPRIERPTVLRPAADGKSWVPERAAAASATVATYDLLHPLTLPARGAIRASLAFADSIPVETRHIYDGVRFDRYQRNRRTDANLGSEFSPAVETRLVFRNTTGALLPPGELRLLRGTADRPLEWIGSDWLQPLAPGEEATLNLGPAAGIMGRRLRTAFADTTPFKASEESFEITLDNQTTDDQTITVIEHLYRGDNHEIIAASADHTPGADPHSIQFVVPVKANSRKTFSYTVRYTW